MATPIVRALDANHDMAFGRGAANFLSGSASTEQRLRCYLLLILGEYFLDTSRGIPWFQPEGSATRPIMGGPRDLSYVETVIKSGVLQVAGIASIQAFSMSFNGSTRRLLISISVTDDDGNPIAIADLGP